jgi:hypothetical protein
MSRSILLIFASLTVLVTAGFEAYMTFCAVVCGATGSSCGDCTRYANIVLITGGLLATFLLVLAFWPRRRLVIPEPDPPPPSEGPYR